MNFLAIGVPNTEHSNMLISIILIAIKQLNIRHIHQHKQKSHSNALLINLGALTITYSLIPILLSSPTVKLVTIAIIMLSMANTINSIAVI
jgi:hypothetical protein